MSGYTTVKTGVEIEVEFDAWRNSEGQIETDWTIWLGHPLNQRVKLETISADEQKALLAYATKQVEKAERDADLP